jgi:hypothetical protein
MGGILGLFLVRADRTAACTVCPWPQQAYIEWHGRAPVCKASQAKGVLAFLQLNWLRVLDTAERPQIDQGICHQLHPIVSLLDAFKSK